MDAMDVITSEDEIEDANLNTENEEVMHDVNQPDGANSPFALDQLSTEDNMREAMQTKLQSALEAVKANPLSNRGDGAIDQATFKSKEAVPSTSRVIVRKRAKKSRILDISALRPILPRKSKEKARQMLKVIARGIIIPKGVIFQRRRERSRRRVRRPNMKMLRLVKKRKVSKSSLHTVWARDRARRQRSRSAESFRSDYECSGCCRCSQFS